MIHDTCDYCFRPFGYAEGQKPICTNCGLENVRKAVVVQSPVVRESAMLAPAREHAVMPPAVPRQPLQTPVKAKPKKLKKKRVRR